MDMESLVDGRFVTAVAEVQARTLVTKSASDRNLFATLYNANLYRGCGHACIYCDTRSECYGIVDISRIAIKVNAIDLLRKELAAKRERGVVGTGSMNDPYQPLEGAVGLTRRALQVLLEFGFPPHVITKSSLVLRDIDILSALVKRLGHAVVTFSLTTVDDELGRRLEPGASLPSERLEAMAALRKVGVRTGAAMMPLLPGLTDGRESMAALIGAVAASGGEYALCGCLTLRDSGRAHYYDALAGFAPEALALTTKIFGDRYLPPKAYSDRVCGLAAALAKEAGLGTAAPRWQRDMSASQLALF